MKHYQKSQIGMLCLFLSISTLCAQEQALEVFLPSSNNIFDTDSQQPALEATATVHYRHHKKLPVTHSGIVIELITSDILLQRTAPLFKQFGKVYFDQLEEGGFTYCILTDFNSLEKAKIYMRQMVSHRAPLAKVVKYQFGKRKRIVQ